MNEMLQEDSTTINTTKSNATGSGDEHYKQSSIPLKFNQLRIDQPLARIFIPFLNLVHRCEASLEC